MKLDQFQGYAQQCGACGQQQQGKDLLPVQSQIGTLKSLQSHSQEQHENNDHDELGNDLFQLPDVGYAHPSRVRQLLL